MPGGGPGGERPAGGSRRRAAASGRRTAARSRRRLIGRNSPGRGHRTASAGAPTGSRPLAQSRPGRGVDLDRRPGDRVPAGDARRGGRAAPVRSATSRSAAASASGSSGRDQPPRDAVLDRLGEGAEARGDQPAAEALHEVEDPARLDLAVGEDEGVGGVEQHLRLGLVEPARDEVDGARRGRRRRCGGGAARGPSSARRRRSPAGRARVSASSRASASTSTSRPL